MRPFLKNNDLNDWYRVGGHELQFFATDSEVQQWLLTGLPAEYAPYRLIGADLVKDGAIYVEDFFECPLGSLVSCMGSRRERFMFNICSDILTPGFDLKRGDKISHLCSFNGLVNLFHGSMIDGERAGSRISVVDRLRHEKTGEERRQDKYLKIYRSLHRIISKSLVYCSIQTFRDGTEEEDCKVQRMTEGAVQSHSEGIRFRNRPGKRIDEIKRKRK